MSAPRVVAIAPGSPAAAAGLSVGDEIVALNGSVPRDVLEYRWLADEGDLDIEVSRDGEVFDVSVTKLEGEPLGVEVHSSVFDRVQTCDNHCEFCFIYQLPKGMRRSLYLKDDDYRLSFLYGNFTTLTRFTEMDLERVITEGLSPLHVSIHTTDPALRSEMLRNKRGGPSLRWLRALLDHGVEVHGQVVVCPGINDGAALEATLAGVLDRFPELATLCLVPLGVSDHHHEPRMRAHTVDEARAVVDAVAEWQEIYLRLLGRRLVFAGDEYYLMAGVPFPPAEAYEGFDMHEDGIGMARSFEMELMGNSDEAVGVRSGFFAAVDGAPAEGYRAPRSAAAGPVAGGCGVGSRLGAVDPAAGGATGSGHTSGGPVGATSVRLRPRRGAPITILTGTLGGAVIAPLLERLAVPEVRVLPVENRWFGGTTGVTGLLVGADLERVLADEPEGERYLLPDVCLSGGTFLDDGRPEDLPRPVEVVPTDGVALRRILDEHRSHHLEGAPAGASNPPGRR